MANLIIRNLANKNIPITRSCKNLLEHIQDMYIDWMHACGGKGRCTTCRIHVLQGIENMSALSAAELKYTIQGRLKATERLTCQSYAYGEVVAEVPPACQLPHIKYSS